MSRNQRTFFSVSFILKDSSNPIYWESSLSPYISKRRMTEIAYLKKKPYSPNSPDTLKISLPRYMHALVDFTKTRYELISSITQST